MAIDVDTIRQSSLHTRDVFLLIWSEFQFISRERKRDIGRPMRSSPMDSSSLFFLFALKLERSSLATRWRAMSPLSNRISGVLSSICIRNWRRSTFASWKRWTTNDRHSSFCTGTILSSNEMISRYLAYADHKGTIGIIQPPKFEKPSEEQNFRLFSMVFWVTSVYRDFSSDSMPMEKCRWNEKWSEFQALQSPWGFIRIGEHDCKRGTDPMELLSIEKIERNTLYPVKKGIVKNEKNVEESATTHEPLSAFIHYRKILFKYVLWYVREPTEKRFFHRFLYRSSVVYTHLGFAISCKCLNPFQPFLSLNNYTEISRFVCFSLLKAPKSEITINHLVIIVHFPQV